MAQLTDDKRKQAEKQLLALRAEVKRVTSVAKTFEELASKKRKQVEDLKEDIRGLQEMLRNK